MPDLFKPTYLDKATRQRRTAKFWYTRIGGRRVPLRVTDKRAAERKAAELLRAAELGFDPDRVEKARRTALADHLLAFEDALRAKGTGDRHLTNLLPRLRRLLDGCGFRTLADVDPDRAGRWLAGQITAGGRPLSAQTQKHIAAHARQLGRWLVQTGRCARDPFAGLAAARSPAADRRYERRPLDDAEVGRLLAYVRSSGVRRGRMDPEGRYLFLRVALETGYRRNELGSLAPESFRLDQEPPAAVLPAPATKNGRPAAQPLRRDLADELRPWLAGRPAGVPVFPVKNKQVNRALAVDLAAAGVERVVAGRTVDVHSLRYTFVSRLASSNAPLAVVSKLARHSDPRLTLAVYAQFGLGELARAVEALPATGCPPESPPAAPAPGRSPAGCG